MDQSTSCRNDHSQWQIKKWLLRTVSTSLIRFDRLVNTFLARNSGRNRDQVIGDGKLMPNNKDLAPPPNKRARKEEDMVDKVTFTLK